MGKIKWNFKPRKNKIKIKINMKCRHWQDIYIRVQINYLKIMGLIPSQKLAQRERDGQVFTKVILVISLSNVRLYTHPSYPKLDIKSVKFAWLDICAWPNINHKIGTDTILKLWPNSTQRLAKGRRKAQVFIKVILAISSSNVRLNKLHVFVCVYTTYN